MGLCGDFASHFPWRYAKKGGKPKNKAEVIQQQFVLHLLQFCTVHNLQFSTVEVYNVRVASSVSIACMCSY